MNTSFESSLFNQFQTKIGKTSYLEGKIEFSSPMRIEGKFDGTIVAKQFLFITDGAEVVADIQGTDILVAGMVKGNIQATGKVELLETAQVMGNITAQQIRLLDGVLFEGRCEMIKRSENIDIFSLPIQDLRTSLEEKRS
jgi:cytoskeletal protein CcmA (bactofilin family)